jgi:hypothetical protein
VSWNEIVVGNDCRISCIDWFTNEAYEFWRAKDEAGSASVMQVDGRECPELTVMMFVYTLLRCDRILLAFDDAMETPFKGDATRSRRR